MFRVSLLRWSCKSLSTSSVPFYFDIKTTNDENLSPLTYLVALHWIQLSNKLAMYAGTFLTYPKGYTRTSISETLS